LIHSCRKTFIR